MQFKRGQYLLVKLLSIETIKRPTTLSCFAGTNSNNILRLFKTKDFKNIYFCMLLSTFKRILEIKESNAFNFSILVED